MTHLSEQSVAPGGQFVPAVSKLQEVMAFPRWTDTNFCCLFVGATFMGTILNYSTFLCTSVNSALTTTVVGCLKNVLTTYVGMVFMAGYEYRYYFYSLLIKNRLVPTGSNNNINDDDHDDNDYLYPPPHPFSLSIHCAAR